MSTFFSLFEICVLLRGIDLGMGLGSVELKLKQPVALYCALMIVLSGRCA